MTDYELEVLKQKAERADYYERENAALRDRIGELMDGALVERVVCEGEGDAGDD